MGQETSVKKRRKKIKRKTCASGGQPLEMYPSALSHCQALSRLHTWAGSDVPMGI